MRGQFRTDLTFALGAMALALFMVACNNQKQNKQAIVPATPGEKIQSILAKMSGGKYNPFADQNRAMAKRIDGATLNMMIVDRETGDRTDVIDSGTIRNSSPESAKDSTATAVSAATSALDDITETATISTGANRPVPVSTPDDRIETQGEPVQCAMGKKCRRLKRLNDRILEKLSDPTKYELQIEVVMILKEPNVVISASGVMNTETTLLTNREGTDAQYQVHAGCVRPRCKKAYIMVSQIDGGNLKGQSAMIFDLKNDSGEYSVAWAAHPQADNYTTTGTVRSAVVVAKERGIKLDPNTQLMLRPEMKPQEEKPKVEPEQPKPETVPIGVD